MEKQDSHIRFCLYARKSSESDERQAISIDSQVNEMQKIAQRDNLEIGEIYRESHTAKKCGQRETFNKLLQEIEQGIYSGIITWSPDRLSRNAGDLGILVDLMDEGKLKMIVTYSQTFTDNPNEKFLLMILGSQAKLENDNRSINIRRGIRNQCQLGYWPGPVPIGYVSETIGGVRKISIDPERGEPISKLFQKVADGIPVKKVIAWINKNTSLRSAKGKHIPQSVIYGILRNKFYAGRFVMKEIEYQGIYQPIVTMELYDRVQTKLRPFRNTYARGDKYSIARFLKCALCGSPVHRQSKIRKLKNGRSNFHTYYRCSRQKDKKCKVEYVLEEDVFRDITKLIDSVDVSKINFPEQIQDEIVRFERMRWDIHARMSESKIKLSIYPMRFSEIDDTTTKMYLQNMILYAKPDRRYYLISLLLASLSQLEINSHSLGQYFTSSFGFFPST